MVDWFQIINDLNGRGLNCVVIAVRVGLHPNGIRELKRGSYREPRYTVGAKLVALHRLHCPYQYEQERA